MAGKQSKKTATTELPTEIAPGTKVRVLALSEGDRFRRRELSCGAVLPDVRDRFVGLVGTVLAEETGNTWSLRRRDGDDAAYYSGGIRFDAADVRRTHLADYIGDRSRIGHYSGDDAYSTDAHFDFVSVEIVTDKPARKPRATKATETKKTTKRTTHKATTAEKPARGKRTKKGA